MSVYATSLVWKFSKAAGSTLLVALAIADFADDEGRAFPAVGTLATKARVSERTTQYALSELVSFGELAIERGTGPKGCNTYVLQLDALRCRPAAGIGGAKAAGGADSAGVQNAAQGGATHCTQTIIEPSSKKKKKESAPAPTFNRATGRIEGIPDAAMAKWLVTFDGLNVAAEISRAECWLLSNPKREKEDYLRFLNNWLSKAHREVKTNPASHRVNAPTKTLHRAAFSTFLHGTPAPADRAPFFQGATDVIDVVATPLQ
ncbi:helix-turn-helix domain-containing protein [uncultured Aquabacterium sp.]|uniref:helix-turn-helix domain-containing protein n=1 Tax=uncultured Aquabacterium sp. TaxID=158753 RepID=UPI0025D5AD83|nr:helix-turn-helix domain-containing protein [uncultured Aquabacterium sp.]